MPSLYRPLLLLFVLLLSHAQARQAALRPLEARLFAAVDGGEGGAGAVGCWEAMMELRSCSNEIVLFFLNGESYLTLPCCRAIRLITRSCWPAMLSTLGFTSEEADILRGYCDAETAPPMLPDGALPPATAMP
ncbi:Egg cell-secreted protein 1.2 [Platanthera guangdongensis]|uniref:Egg cell-secreted protein 1.2 n=1 Tax=Platanthera guangdongensis TaxID=2320717 RepID=A0ABR2MMC8_9ASPA